MSRRRTVSAAQKREAARREADRIARRRRQRRGLVVIGSVLVAVLVATAGFIIWQGSQRSYLDDVGRTPTGADRTGGIPVSAPGTAGVAEPGAPRLDVYLDVQSAESVAFWLAQGDDLQALASEGAVALWVHLVGFVDGGENGASTRAGEAAVVVADRSPELFLAFVDAAFAERGAGVDHLNDPDLEALAREVGVEQPVVDAFTDNLFDDWFVAATDQARRDGVDTVPTLQLDGGALEADWTVPGSLRTAVEGAAAS